MSTIMPQSEMCRKAVAWIDEELRNRPDANLPKLLEEASLRFNLGPSDCEFLDRFFKERDGD